VLHEGKADEFYARCTDEMKAAVPLAQLKAIVGQLGPLEALSPRGTTGEADLFRCKFAAGEFNCFITLDAKDRVAGLFYKPAPAEGALPHADYVPKTRFSLPFKGAWTVGNGGRDAAKNNHVGNAQQNFAYDFTRAHKGDGKALADYEAFGQDVLAPADGSVVEVLDGSPDLAPGDHDPYVITGNMVVLDCGNSEFTYLCHFKRGSIVAKVGDKVVRGQKLGLCGNSGNTSEPHIHMHVQNGGVLHHGEGLPCPFSKITVDGKPADSAEPSRGEKVENAE
jgi:murein DD-endopeptidase MepM/ murein hydrolase activator NlpD